jgi:hypothetical protein
MSDLTRLRRYIRGLSGDWFGDLEQVLDATDQLREELEITERDLSNYNSLDDDTAKVIVQENAERLVKTIGGLGGLYPHTILSWLVESWGSTGMNTLTDAYERLKAEQKILESDDSLGDLDDHPF